MLNPKQSEDGNAPQNEPQNVMKQDAARSGAAHARVPELPRTGSAMSTSTAVPTPGGDSDGDRDGKEMKAVPRGSARAIARAKGQCAALCVCVCGWVGVSIDI